MKFGSVIKDNILFLHGFSGADTISAFFRQGKLKFISLLEKHEELQNLVAMFKEPFDEPANIAEEGKVFFSYTGLMNVNPFVIQDIGACPITA